MGELEFDPIAGLIGRDEVVSLLCYVSEPLSTEDKYCLVLDPWFETKRFVDRGEVVAQIPGSARADGKSVVWVRKSAQLNEGTPEGSADTADLVALSQVTEDPTVSETNPSPPPLRYPRS